MPNDTAPPPSAPEAAAPDTAAEAEAPSAEPAASPRDQKLTRQFAALSRKEKEFTRKQQEWESQRGQQQTEMQKFFAARKAAAGNPDEWLKMGGIDYQRVVDHYAGKKADPTNDRLQKLDETMQQWELKLQQREDQLKNTQRELVKMQFIDKITNVVHSDPETFELIQHYEAVPDVFEYMDLYAQEHGKLIDVRDAAKAIEDYLEQDRADDVKRALAAKKIAKRVGWQNPSEAKADAESQPDAAAAKSPKTKALARPVRRTPKSNSPAKRVPKDRNQSAYDADDIWQKIRERANRM